MGDLDRWIVARTQTGREKWAAENVARQGHEFYLPLLRAPRPRDPGRVEALFPGYLFVKITGQWRFLTGTFGVVDVVMAGDGPAPLRESEIDWIRSLEGPGGYIELPEVDESYHAGERLRVNVGGVWVSAVCTGMKSTDRVNVLLNALGRQTRADIPVEDVKRDG